MKKPQTSESRNSAETTASPYRTRRRRCSRCTCSVELADCPRGCPLRSVATAAPRPALSAASHRDEHARRVADRRVRGAVRPVCDVRAGGGAAPWIQAFGPACARRERQSSPHGRQPRPSSRHTCVVTVQCWTPGWSRDVQKTLHWRRSPATQNGCRWLPPSSSVLAMAVEMVGSSARGRSSSGPHPARRRRAANARRRAMPS